MSWLLSKWGILGVLSGTAAVSGVSVGGYYVYKAVSSNSRSNNPVVNANDICNESSTHSYRYQSLNSYFLTRSCDGVNHQQDLSDNNANPVDTSVGQDNQQNKPNPPGDQGSQPNANPGKGVDQGQGASSVGGKDSSPAPVTQQGAQGDSGPKAPTSAGDSQQPPQAPAKPVGQKDDPKPPTPQDTKPTPPSQPNPPGVQQPKGQEPTTKGKDTQKPQPPVQTKQPKKSIPSDVQKYLKRRTINLVVSANDNSGNITSTGFILSPATQNTHEGKSHVYFVLTDLKTVNDLTSKSNSYQVYYGSKPYTDTTANQLFYPLSLNSDWHYKAIKIKFDDIPDGYESYKESLGVYFGVLMVDLDPLTSGRITNQPIPSTLKISPNTEKQRKQYLVDLKDNMTRYGDVGIDEKPVNEGYTVNNNSSSDKDRVQYISELGDKLTKRTSAEDQPLEIEGQTYHFPTQDYHVDLKGVSVGSPLISYKASERNPKKKFNFAGLVTKLSQSGDQNTKTLISSVYYDDDYDAITDQSDSENPLCYSIANAMKVESQWLKSSSLGLENKPDYYPGYCQ